MSAPQVANPPSFFLSLPTSDVTAATKFFAALDFEPVPAYSDSKTTSLRLPGANANVCVMVHEHSRFKKFMRPNTEIPDANKVTEALFSWSAKTKEEVDAVIAKAVEAGGKADPYTLPNYGGDMGMYSRSFADLDGHIWEAVAMVGEGCGQAHGQA